MKIESKQNNIIETLHHVRQFAGKTLLIKLGGSILDDPKLIRSLCTDLCLLQGAGIKLVLVHGGSKAINRALDQYNITSHFVDGLRVTTQQAMTIIEMVLCGQVNKLLVRELNACGVQAIGLSGVDNQLLQGDYYSEQHGYAGTIEKINLQALSLLLQTQNTDQTAQTAALIPVIAPIGVHADGHALNINADWAASCLAVALGVHKLIYLTDQAGIYDHNKQLISELDREGLAQLISAGVVTAGMLTKVKTLLNALDQGIDNIHVINGTQPHALLTEIFTHEGIGTVCKRAASPLTQEATYAMAS